MFASAFVHLSGSRKKSHTFDRLPPKMMDFLMMCNGMCVTRHQVINHEMSVSIKQKKKKKKKLWTVSLRNGQ